ncbi:sugar O-acetyltransferase [Paraoerskovia marina]|uniref:sugar O-acetyltransferase n=1 Tax=Paraoerskovia marina TaxID=545619 RepID=UPI000492DBEE|nr:sugar O-acetyltransferase [Paraoerskovia marina]
MHHDEGTPEDVDREVRRRMDAHELYDGARSATLMSEQDRAKDLEFDYNHTRPAQRAERARILGELLGAVGTGVWVEPPLRVAYGYRIRLGDDVYVNAGLNVVDDVDVEIGARTMLAPNVVISTTGHPVHPELRTGGVQFSAPVRIGADVWVGSGAVILPGVEIGDGAVVAAGAVVAGHVPARTVVGGVPARVLRAITEDDREWAYRPPRTLPSPGPEPHS